MLASEAIKKLKAEAQKFGATIDTQPKDSYGVITSYVDAPDGYVWRCDEIKSIVVYFGVWPDNNRQSLNDAISRMAHGVAADSSPDES